MRFTNARIVSILLTITLLLSCMSALTLTSAAAGAEGISYAEGWYESAFAEWSGVSGADGYNAYIAKVGASYTKIDSELVRKYGDGFRVDAVGLSAGQYTIKIVPTSSGKELGEKTMITDTLTVSAYDRSGYAHFNYTSGVGAYNDDGTLKKNAIVLYVTEETKNTVSVTSKDGTTVKGIGNILNSVGQDVGGGKNSKGGKANTNSDIIRKLALDGTPLVVRIIGNVTLPDGLTAYDSVDFGGSVGDNGAMARMSGGKDITIEGIGSDAVMNGWGLHFICQSSDYTSGIGKSFEVRNISFMNVPEDCVGMEGQQSNSTLSAPVERCWIHHCNFYAPVISNPAESDKDGGDGACDFKRGQYFTNSYCYYDGYHKTNLVGSSDDSLQYNITYHHNYWKDCESRGPLARQANIHMYNNIFENQTSYCMSLRANTYIFSEYNLFLKSKNVVDDKTGGVCKSYNNSFTACSFGSGNLEIVTDKTQTVSSNNKYANFDTNSSLSYIPSGDYILEESIEEMKATVLTEAGAQKKVILKAEDVNTSVIPANRYPTAAVALNYSKSLNKTTVTSISGTFDNIVFNVKKLDSACIVVGGSANDCDIVFYVDTEVDISMTALDGTYLPILCNEAGELMLRGTGTAYKLPSGYYFIQSEGYDTGSGKYKEAKISSLTITATDPNAATNPIPTPPPVVDDPNQGGESGGNTGSGDSGNSGNNNGGTTVSGVVITENSETHNFTTEGKTDPDGFFSINGNTSVSKGSVSFNGESLTTCLKIESSTNISFTATEKGALVLVFGGSTNAAGKGIKINGESYDIPDNQILELLLEAGSYAITKDDSINLFYMAFVPASSGGVHVHNYVDEETASVSCTTDGLITYTCECGDSYTEIVVATGHDFVDGSCMDCGIDDPNYSGNEDDENTDSGETPDNPGNTENPDDSNNTETPDSSDKTETPEPERELNFFEKIWKAIVDFFKMLFGIK